MRLPYVVPIRFNFSTYYRSLICGRGEIVLRFKWFVEGNNVFRGDGIWGSLYTGVQRVSGVVPRVCGGGTKWLYYQGRWMWLLGYVIVSFCRMLRGEEAVHSFSSGGIASRMLRGILLTTFGTPAGSRLQRFRFVIIEKRRGVTQLVSPITRGAEGVRRTKLSTTTSVVSGSRRTVFISTLPGRRHVLVRDGYLMLPFFQRGSFPLYRPTSRDSLGCFTST